MRIDIVLKARSLLLIRGSSLFCTIEVVFLLKLCFCEFFYLFVLGMTEEGETPKSFLKDLLK
jgi:hypothetical protein